MPADFFSHNNIILITGIIAGILTAVSMMPQIFKTIKTKKAEHISPVMLIILIAGVSLWVVYGCIKNDWPIILTNSFSVLVNTCMLFLRWRYKKNK
jgi:MtN3 and saliva related transmembrane protein